MKRILVVISFLLFASGRAQEAFSPDTVGSRTVSDNIYNRSLYGDSLCSSFCIVIKKEVKSHKHITHSEHVVVLEGEGEMMLGEKNFKIKKGDLVFIPKNTVHSVRTTSKTPLKVYSIQSPLFDGKDRVMTDK